MAIQFPQCTRGNANSISSGTVSLMIPNLDQPNQHHRHHVYVVRHKPIELWVYIFVGNVVGIAKNASSHAHTRWTTLTRCGFVRWMASTCTDSICTTGKAVFIGFTHTRADFLFAIGNNVVDADGEGGHTKLQATVTWAAWAAAAILWLLCVWGARQDYAAADANWDRCLCGLTDKTRAQELSKLWRGQINT